MLWHSHPFCFNICFMASSSLSDREEMLLPMDPCKDPPLPPIPCNTGEGWANESLASTAATYFIKQIDGIEFPRVWYPILIVLPNCSNFKTYIGDGKTFKAGYSHVLSNVLRNTHKKKNPYCYKPCLVMGA